VTTTPKALAAALLDAQVAWAIGELTGERLGPVVAAAVDDALAIAATLKLADVADREDIKTTARVILDIAGSSEVVADLAVEYPTALHQMPEAATYTLADVADTADVEELVETMLTLDRLHERTLDKIAESPLVRAVATTFVTKLVTDVVQQNRERAEKVPGMSSLLSIGTSAASKVRSVTDRPLEALLGDATGKGTAYAIRRINAALLQLVSDAPLKGAAMESWELLANQPLGQLDSTLSHDDVRRLAGAIYALVARATGSEYVGAAADTFVDVVFDRYAEYDLAALLEEVGVTRDDIVDIGLRHVPIVVDALTASGDLDRLIRARLAPFFESAAVRQLLTKASVR